MDDLSSVNSSDDSLSRRVKAAAKDMPRSDRLASSSDEEDDEDDDNQEPAVQTIQANPCRQPQRDPIPAQVAANTVTPAGRLSCIEEHLATDNGVFACGEHYPRGGRNVPRDQQVCLFVSHPE